MSTDFDKIVHRWMNNEKMSGYIEKSALAEELLNLAIVGKDKIKISSVINMIEGLPAADVAEVVHGHWKFYGEDGHGYGLWRCTYCGNIVPEKAAKHFCPFCGARMDGGRKR